MIEWIKGFIFRKRFIKIIQTGDFDDFINNLPTEHIEAMSKIKPDATIAISINDNQPK